MYVQTSITLSNFNFTQILQGASLVIQQAASDVDPLLLMVAYFCVYFQSDLDSDFEMICLRRLVLLLPDSVLNSLPQRWLVHNQHDPYTNHPNMGIKPRLMCSMHFFSHNTFAILKGATYKIQPIFQFNTFKKLTKFINIMERSNCCDIMSKISRYCIVEIATETSMLTNQLCLFL